MAVYPPQDLAMRDESEKGGGDPQDLAMRTEDEKETVGGARLWSKPRHAAGMI